MNHFGLESENFRLSLDFNVFESDIAYPCNTTLTVSVYSDGFSATTDMDIDVKRITGFCGDLKKIYDFFRGEATISESYGKQNILFSCDRHGHIFVSGLLCSGGANGFWHELKFENILDQSFLPPLIRDLTAFSEKYKCV